jgi:hypothetical protein
VLNHAHLSFLCSLLLFPAALSTCARMQDSSNLDTFRFDGEIAFSLEYPASWTAVQRGNTARFSPPEPYSGYIDLVVYNPDVTPPLAVHVTFDTLRVVHGRIGPVPVMQRDPAAVIERSVAFIAIERHVVEVRLMAEREYDAVFDHMLVTLTPYQLNQR